VLSNSIPSDNKKESSSNITNSNSNSNNNNNNDTIVNDTPKRTMNRFFINNPYRIRIERIIVNTNSKLKDEVTKDTKTKWNTNTNSIMKKEQLQKEDDEKDNEDNNVRKDETNNNRDSMMNISGRPIKPDSDSEEIVGVNVELGSPTVITFILIPSSQKLSFVLEKYLLPDVFILIMSLPVSHFLAYLLTLHAS